MPTPEDNVAKKRKENRYRYSGKLCDVETAGTVGTHFSRLSTTSQGCAGKMDRKKDFPTTGRTIDIIAVGIVISLYVKD